MPATWFDGLTYEVSAGFSSASGGYGAWGTGLWGTATWGPDVVFTDISPYVKSIQTSRRFSRELQEWGPGTATITLSNQDGRFSPSNPSSPYVIAGVTGIRPWRPIIIKLSGVTVFTGYAISWVDAYEQGSPRGGGSTTTVQCVDEFASLARFEGLPTVAQGGGEPSGERIHRVLDNAGHRGLRAVDIGRVTLQPTVHDQNTVTEMKLVTDTEGGSLYVGADGAVTFEDRYYLVEQGRATTVQAVFGDGRYVSWLNLPGTTGNNFTTTDKAQLDITGDIDIRFEIVANDWTPSGPQTIVGKFVATGDQRSWMAQLNMDGTLRIVHTSAGTLGSQIITNSTDDITPPSAGFTTVAGRITMDVNDGSGNRVVRFYRANTRDGPWTQIGNPVITAGTTSIFSGTAPLEVGSWALGAAESWNGKVAWVQVRNGIEGTVVANPDFQLQIAGITTFLDGAGNTWTRTGTAAIVDNTTALPELPYTDITLSYDGDQLVNIVSLQRAATEAEQEAQIEPPVVTVQDETSRALYGDSRYSRTDLINESNTDLQGLGQFYLSAHKDAEQRVEEIKFTPRYRGLGEIGRLLLIANATNRKVRDLIRVIRRPPGSETIVRDCHIAGITHNFTSAGEWTVTFDLSSATVYGTFTSFDWDEAQWDGATWFF
jgi:hypothetical protein